MPDDDLETTLKHYDAFNPATAERIRTLVRERDQARAERDALVEALTPSAETKAEFLGEFQFHYEAPCEGVTVDVSWTSIKEIMHAIHNRAKRHITKTQ